MRANPWRAATAIAALLDPAADPDDRLDGALLVANAIDDLALIRSFLFKRPGE